MLISTTVLIVYSVTAYHNTKKALKDELLSAVMQTHDTQRIISINLYFNSLIIVILS
jgi:hypothetical protein